jgi:hypothetical protein
MERADDLRRILLLSAGLALALSGCALPPGLTTSRSDRLLHSLLQGDASSAQGSPESAPAKKEAAPYPTALKPGTPIPPPALPLQQPATPAARPLDPNQIAGRLPVRIPEQTIPNSPPPPPPRPEQPASYSQPAENSAPADSAAAITLQPAAPGPTNEAAPSPATAPLATNTPSPVETSPAPPLEIWNQFVTGATPGLEGLAMPDVRQVVNRVESSPAPVVMTPSVSASSPAPQSADQPAIEPAENAAEESSPSDQSEPEPQAPEPIDRQLERLIAALQEEIRQRTERKETQELPALYQKLRLLQLIADRPDEAVEQIEQLPAAERDAFKQLVFALTTWLSPEDSRRPSLRNAKILRSLQEVEHRLSAVSKLDLKNLTFCEKVESFGWYTEFPRAEFTPRQQVILYVEVQNFAAEEKTATAFETELQGTYQIYDAEGNIVDEHQLPLDREVCRNYRRDYFLAYRIHMPADISPGRYRLELTVEDLKAKKDFKGRKQGEAMIEFTIK